MNWPLRNHTLDMKKEVVDNYPLFSSSLVTINDYDQDFMPLNYSLKWKIKIRSFNVEKEKHYLKLKILEINLFPLTGFIQSN